MVLSVNDFTFEERDFDYSSKKLLKSEIPLPHGMIEEIKQDDELHDSFRARNNEIFAAFEADILAEVVETIIPKTDIVGAKDLKVHDFIQKMIADCYDLPVQTNFKNGLKTLDDSAVDSYAKPFAVCDKMQRETLLNKLATATDASQKDFFVLVKNLTIQGFTSSEFVMTTFLRYKMAPGHYYGCVPVE